MRHRDVVLSAAIALVLIFERAVAASDSASAVSLETVTVTATRVIRDGYEAPTPTYVLGGDILT
jgi:hypothetical protein